MTPEDVEQVTDPVCQMQMSFEDAFARTSHKGEIFYFCSDQCLTEFQRDPGAYVSKQRKAAG